MAIIINTGKNPAFNNPSNDNKLSLITEAPRKVIVGTIDHDEYGIFGNCYSQPEDFVKLLCEQSSATFFDTNTPEHELGQFTVDIILCALNVLPNIKAWQTPPNSAADVKWKWDLIIEHECYLYPVQVKSSLDAIKECKNKFRETLGIAIEKLGDRRENIRERYQNTIDNYIERNRLTSRKDANIVAKIKKRDQELKQLNDQLDNYKKASPLYIWAARDEDTIKALVRIFVKLFSISENVLELEAQSLKQYKHKYKNIQDFLIEEENQKLNTINEIISLIKKYLDLKNNYLNKNSLINLSTNKPSRLEDVLCLKKSNELLELAENMLKYYNKSLSIAHDSYDDKMVSDDNKQIIESYKIKFKKKVLKVIQQGKYRSGMLLDKKVTDLIKNCKNDDPDIDKIVDLVASQEEILIKNKKVTYIEPQALIVCLDKLIYFDVSSSDSIPHILQDIKKKYTYIVAKEVTFEKEKIEEYDDLNSIFF
ncbi:hypothetical protein [Nostoc sp. 'Peltigera membranacea cyanobiont' N6]|uniref:hypothetical protein n=1 Tax=Nostoc sp. 'Peltigera membranacea cyanobiont' N6 TaxID=1261031 RepID=UPI000CF31046|nr:hypothetical protein [Nostoc sp. 'Peltigera membranacea cyanobiont' N6]AVH68332.1 hypothetical protein NPM_20041 [Nostoc sp. 'Peltigera membranacea cyanobiont' N6]